jgi:hypothetical protein
MQHTFDSISGVVTVQISNEKHFAIFSFENEEEKE